ncbi:MULTISPECIES: arginase [Ralstonia solanacearum species complex]|uniref:Arginase n=4 Tax=Ralstonia solanacearum species complex TaxID=3116862 RepID=A0AAD0WHI4_RALSL|nr:MULTISPECIES: arginase [Ralstonia solanacearum species complex]CCA80370.1 arginase [blood disease bacterium R229]AMP38875.1 arginase [Ralstonia solanacearum]AQW29912.1 arginase [blood disease bacterium A2-HR MARDI]AXV82881.1 arginase [Ralstonia solanacearum]AXV87702.1 arginase [Ralstonia solanacearum]
MTIIDLIGAAIGCGAQDDGCKDGPRALLQAGALQRLQTPDTHGGLVHGIELATSAGHSRSARLAALPGVAGFSRALADATAHSVHEGHVPVVIGGDHSCAIGTWSGVASALRPAGPFGLIWIDAHLDSHTPQTSDSGAIHGMPLAALLGHGARALTQVRDASPKLLPQHVVVIGARSYEPAERALIDQLGVRVIDAAEVARSGLRAVMADAIRIATGDTAAFGVTVDLDAFDPAVAPGVGSPEPGGLTGQDMTQALAACARDARFAAFELVEYNPRHDKGGITARLALDLLGAVAGALHAQRREYASAA